MRRLLAVLALVVACVLVPAAPASAVGSPCLVPRPEVWTCAGLAHFSSYVISQTFRPFQAAPGTSSQPDITVTFGAPYVTTIRFWANDPDFANNKVWVFQSGSGWIQAATMPADGIPGLFSVSDAAASGHLYMAVRLESDDSDYVNWRLEYQQYPHGGSWCPVTHQSWTCDGVTATVASFYQGSNFDPFQSTLGTGSQNPIVITFDSAVYAVGATAVDADYSGTYMDAYTSKGFLAGTVYFDNDNTPGYTTASTKSVADSRGIKFIVLTPAPNDYVTFQGVTVTPL